MAMGGAKAVAPAGGGGIKPELGFGGKRKRAAEGSDTVADSKAIVASFTV
jgi:hypothetical protein